MPRRGELHIELYVDFADDPEGCAKLARYGRDARSIRDLFVQMICYCKRTKSDGHVPVEQVGKLVYPDSPARGMKDADRLIECDLAQRTETGYFLPSYLKRNKSRAQIEAAGDLLADSGHESGVFGNHVRHHVKKGVAKADCPHCAREPLGSTRREPEHGPETSRSGKARTESESKTTNSTTSTGSPTVPAGFAARIVRAYVDAARDAGVPAPAETQTRIERAARSLHAQGYDPGVIEQAARNAAAGGWDDLARQIQRDASRSNPTAGTASTTDQRVQAALAAGRAAQAELDRGEIPA